MHHQQRMCIVDSLHSWRLMCTCEGWCALLKVDVHSWWLMCTLDGWCALLMVDVHSWWLICTLEGWCAVLVVDMHSWRLMHTLDDWYSVLVVDVPSIVWCALFMGGLHSCCWHVIDVHLWLTECALLLLVCTIDIWCAMFLVDVPHRWFRCTVDVCHLQTWLCSWQHTQCTAPLGQIRALGDLILSVDLPTGTSVLWLGRLRSTVVVKTVPPAAKSMPTIDPTPPLSICRSSCCALVRSGASDLRALVLSMCVKFSVCRWFTVDL